MDTFRIELDELLKIASKARNKTKRVTWLMHNANITRPTAISLVEGTPTRIEFTTLARVCEALQCTPNDILTPINL